MMRMLVNLIFNMGKFFGGKFRPISDKGGCSTHAYTHI